MLRNIEDEVCGSLFNELPVFSISLAEFVISLAEKNITFDAFKSVLLKNGAEFTVCDLSVTISSPLTLSF